MTHEQLNSTAGLSQSPDEIKVTLNRIVLWLPQDQHIYLEPGVETSYEE